ncbi:MAG: amidohydrolase [Clostridiales Family XIII bacterium]|jgi:predicted amidohydrolase YtcJ|nr:amidohydrolase [Clostridiales Family XIII bacterium]
MNGFDFAIKNANIITMDGNLSRKRWLAVEGGKVAALGDGEFTGEAAKILDVEGKTVLPGLTDSHAHATMTGIGMRGLDFSGYETVADILEKLREYCGKLDDDTQPVFALNLPSAEMLKDDRVPTREEVDGVTGAHPTMLVLWTVHGGVLNSAAIPLAKLQPGMEYVEKDGYFNDDKTSFHVIGNLFGAMSSEEYKQIYFEVAKACASKGITTLHALDGMMVKDDKDTEALKDILGDLPIELVPYTQTFDYEKIYGYGFKQIGGCLSIDGSPGQFTAAYSVPYPALPGTRGFLTYTDAELYAFVTEASKRGMQCAFHAIGDRAVDQIIYIYQQVDREIGIRHLRHRIEHFSLPTERHMEMAAEMNIIASSQPAIGNMLDNKGGCVFENWSPPEVAPNHEKTRRLIEAGITVLGGSDSPVTPMDSFFGLDACINAYNPDRRMSLDDALRIYIVNPAYAEHKEDVKGSLEPGKQADFVVIDKDPYREEGAIDRSVITVEATYKKGTCVYTNVEQ